MTVKAGQSFNSVITQYGPPWDGMNGTGTTSTGIKLGGVGSNDSPGGYNIAAVDPSVIPYGTTFTIDGLPGTWLAADTGGAFHVGTAKIDAFTTKGHDAAKRWGAPVKRVTILFVGKGRNDPALTRARNDASIFDSKGHYNLPAGVPTASQEALQSGLSLGDPLGVGGFLKSLGYVFTREFWMRAGLIFFGLVGIVGGIVLIGKDFTASQTIGALKGVVK